ncbi:hypothetical protein A4A49_35194 [Nicotiana attenuata]|uniref:Uncharacterized protein n=1 Tax=Nicotiana attenuata TaxID=49451 RepID=A0A1J6I6R3_NICAT|nr:hypothetical protein A4A49_35194 [Nicotiana attenuata]
MLADPRHPNYKQRREMWSLKGATMTGFLAVAKGKYSSYGSSFEQSHSISSPYRYEVSYGHNLKSGWDEYPYYDWNESEVRQPPQEQNGNLEELMYKFMNRVEERHAQDDEAINNLTMQEYAWIDPVKECRNKLRMILQEQSTAQNEAKKERKERGLQISLEDFGLMSSIKNPKE